MRANEERKASRMLLAGPINARPPLGREDIAHSPNSMKSHNEIHRHAILVQQDWLNIASV